DLNIALEKLSEGDYQIHWSSEIVICDTETKLNLSKSKEFFFTHDSLHGNEKKYLVHQYSALSFEQALLDGMDLEFTYIDDTQQPTATENTDLLEQEDISDFSQDNTQDQTSGSHLDLTDFRTIDPPDTSKKISSMANIVTNEVTDPLSPLPLVTKDISFG